MPIGQPRNLRDIYILNENGNVIRNPQYLPPEEREPQPAPARPDRPRMWQEFAPRQPDRPVEAPRRDMWQPDQNLADAFRDPDRPIPEDMPVPAAKKVPFYNYKLIDLMPRMASKVTKGEVGVEIECEGTHLFEAPIQYWACHPDGSLRQTEGHPPVEYVLKKPLERAEVTKALTYLTHQLKQAKSQVRDSHRSSVHIHLNCQQMTLKEIINLVCMYLFFEHALVEFSGQERVGNLFCLRAKDAQYWVRNIVEGLRQGNFANVYHENFRYTSCNTASLAKFGSLEFRSMRGTVDQELIQNWIDLLCHIKDRSADFADPLKMYEMYSSMEPMEFFRYIFRPKPNLMALLGTTACLESGMNEGSIFVRDIAYAIEEWSDAKPEPKAKPEPGRAGDPWSQGFYPRPRGVSDRAARLARAQRSGWYITNSTSPEPRVKEFRDPGTREIRVARVNRYCRVAFDEHGLICEYDYRLEEVQTWYAEA